MSILGLYAHMWWDADDPDDDDEDQTPMPVPELLSADSGAVWWTSAQILDADE